MILILIYNIQTSKQMKVMVKDNKQQMEKKNRLIPIIMILALIIEFYIVGIKDPQKVKNTLHFKPGILPPFQDGTMQKPYTPLPSQKHELPWQSKVPLKRQVTLVITTCDRFDLLRRTINSFMKMNTFPIKETLIMNDGESTDQYKQLQKQYPDFKFFASGKRVGQLKALDMLYTKIQTDYFFHSEDDWEFIKSGFIEYSMDRMEQDPRINFVRVKRGKALLEKVQMRHATTKFAGLSLNPTLRRLRDYKQFQQYSAITKNMSQGKGAGTCQYLINRFYMEHGYYCLVSKQVFFEHIGLHRGIQRVNNLQIELIDPVADER